MVLSWSPAMLSIAIIGRLYHCRARSYRGSSTSVVLLAHNRTHSQTRTDTPLPRHPLLRRARLPNSAMWASVPDAGLEPARLMRAVRFKGTASTSSANQASRGDSGVRTRVAGFADLRLTTRPNRHYHFIFLPKSHPRSKYFEDSLSFILIERLSSNEWIQTFPC